MVEGYDSRPRAFCICDPCRASLRQAQGRLTSSPPEADRAQHDTNFSYPITVQADLYA